MNEKIRELISQSYEATTVTTIDPFTQEVVVDFIDGTKPFFNQEKFAELIVKECINSCENHNLESFGILPVRAHMVTKSCQNNIKQHFGVKENERED